MTKTELILKYDGDKMTSVEIALKVGCTPGYVRTVWQRQRGEVLRQTQAAENARQAAVWKTGDRVKAKSCAKEKQLDALASGASREEASRIYKREYNRVLRETCDIDLARRAARNAWRATPRSAKKRQARYAD